MANAMRMIPRPILLAIAVVPLLASEALAWGDTAHRVVCEVAFRELSPGARERVRALIRRAPEFRLFADACTWPDHPRRRGTEHFVNLPRDAAGLGAAACPLAEACVSTAIAADLAVLSSPTADEPERLEALKFLGHWVGDVHQPLHVAFQDDRGGNAIRVAGGLCGGACTRSGTAASSSRSLAEILAPSRTSCWTGSRTSSGRRGGPLA